MAIRDKGRHAHTAKTKDIEADAASSVESVQWHRAHKVPSPLRPGSAETRLTKWLRRTTWTPEEAALLVLGFDPETKQGSPLGFTEIDDLCGEVRVYDVIQHGERSSFEDQAKRIVAEWRRRTDASEKIEPSEFVGWCLEHHIDDAWLAEVPTPIERTYPHLVHAAVTLAAWIWPNDSQARALRKLKEDGWTIRQPSQAPLAAPGSKEVGSRKVLQHEAMALPVMRDLEASRLQEKIDALLAAGKLPLYEWPSCIRTNEPRDALVNKAELVALLRNGEHLNASRQGAVLPVQRTLAHQSMILAKLRELGFDPQALPRTPAGRPSPAKGAARRALPLSAMSDAVFARAWQQLRNAGEIAEA